MHVVKNYLSEKECVYWKELYLILDSLIIYKYSLKNYN